MSARRHKFHDTFTACMLIALALTLLLLGVILMGSLR